MRRTPSKLAMKWMPLSEIVLGPGVAPGSALAEASVASESVAASAVTNSLAVVVRIENLLVAG